MIQAVGNLYKPKQGQWTKSESLIFHGFQDIYENGKTLDLYFWTYVGPKITT